MLGGGRNANTKLIWSALHCSSSDVANIVYIPYAAAAAKVDKFQHAEAFSKIKTQTAYKKASGAASRRQSTNENICTWSKSRTRKSTRRDRKNRSRVRKARRWMRRHNPGELKGRRDCPRVLLTPNLAGAHLLFCGSELSERADYCDLLLGRKNRARTYFSCSASIFYGSN